MSKSKKQLWADMDDKNLVNKKGKALKEDGNLYDYDGWTAKEMEAEIKKVKEAEEKKLAEIKKAQEEEEKKLAEIKKAQEVEEKKEAAAKAEADQKKDTPDSGLTGDAIESKDDDMGELEEDEIPLEDEEETPSMPQLLGDITFEGTIFDYLFEHAEDFIGGKLLDKGESQHRFMGIGGIERETVIEAIETDEKTFFIIGKDFKIGDSKIQFFLERGKFNFIKLKKRDGSEYHIFRNDTM